mgnify:CR=1 FL=1
MNNYVFGCIYGTETYRIKFEISETGVPNNNKNREEALLALQTLGFNKLLIEKTLDKILKNNSDYGVEDLIRLALKVL